MFSLDGINLEELFVGSVAVAQGLMALGVAIFQWQAGYQLRTLQRIDRRWGRNVTRVVLALIGLGLIALGVAVALGFGPNKSPPVAGRNPTSSAADL